MNCSRSMMKRATIAAIGITMGLAWRAAASEPERLLIGWAQGDITPPGAVALGGMPYARITSEISDPLTATALVLEAPYQLGSSEPVIFISCDLRSIRETLRDGVREHLREWLLEVDPMRVILNATHTHNAPPLWAADPDLDAMSEAEYQAFAIPRIAAIAREAWENRRPGGISYGLAHAVIGHNRIMAFKDGQSRMGGRLVNHPGFSHIEGYEDSAVSLLYTWDAEGKLTGVAVNVAVPAQVNQAESVISADYWHDTRVELRRRLGENLYVLPQLSSAGDQMSRQYIYREAEERMRRLQGISYREQIARRLADAAESILDIMRDQIEWNPPLAHRGELVPLSRRRITEAEEQTARREIETAQARYEEAMQQADADPAVQNDPQWQRGRDRTLWVKRRGERVLERRDLAQSDPQLPVELHVIRLGDIVFATNPFELYLDFGVRIKARSPAIQTFVVQHASGSQGYVPPHRSVAGGAYGAVPASNRVGPEGGQELVDWTLDAIRRIRMGPEVRLQPAKWEMVFEDTFDRAEPGAAWMAVNGEWHIEAGRLASSDRGAFLVTADPIPGLHRIEITAASFEGAHGNVSDLSLLLHGNTAGHRSGYFVQFGGHRNTQNNLMRTGTILKFDDIHRITPGRFHTVVAEYDGRFLRLTVDGETILETEERHPLLGADHDRVGIYTWSPAQIERVRIYRAEARPETNGSSPTRLEE